MRYLIIPLLGFLIFVSACRDEKPEPLTAGEVVDSAIAVAGGPLYRSSRISFDFREYSYESYLGEKGRTLLREIPTDSGIIRDIRAPEGFRRYLGDSLLQIPDTTARKYSNAVNSVHYFAYLPHGLNDRAVNKELLGKVRLKDREYYKLRVTFDEAGGGEDFEDVFVYWFNTRTFRPDYLAYAFHTNGGGMRFREAYNDREAGGIRFQDYINYKPAEPVVLEALDKAFAEGRLDTLSRIELRNVRVSPDNYN